MCAELFTVYSYVLFPDMDIAWKELHNNQNCTNTTRIMYIIRLIINNNYICIYNNYI